MTEGRSSLRVVVERGGTVGSEPRPIKRECHCEIAGMRNAVALLLTVAGLHGCDFAKPSFEERTVCAITADLVGALGSMDDAASLSQPWRAHVTKSASGGWVVVEDFGGPEALRYSTTGQYLGPISQRGAGPGELESPARAAIDPTDSLWISEPRGKAVIFAPSGAPTRTIMNPALHPIDGFTPSGLPFSMLVRADEPPALFPFAVVWSRRGDSLFTVGPGGFAAPPTSRPRRLLISKQLAAVADTVFYAPGDSMHWLAKWTPATEEMLISVADVEKFLAGASTLGRPRPVAVTAQEDGSVFILVAVRRRPESEEEDLKYQYARQLELTPQTLSVRFAPTVLNAVYDGVLLHVSNHAVRAVAIFDEYPWRFAAVDHYYTLREEESGLIQVRLWRFETRCQ